MLPMKVAIPLLTRLHAPMSVISKDCIYRHVDIVVENAAGRTVEACCAKEARKALLSEYQQRPQLGYADAVGTKF